MKQKALGRAIYLFVFIIILFLTKLFSYGFKKKKSLF